MSEALLRVEGLKKHFPVRSGVFSRISGYVQAVDGIDFSIIRGQTYGLVGESGCGKSTAGYTITRLLAPTEGAVYYQGKNLFELNAAETRAARRKIQIVFQDPYSALNPRKSIGDAMKELLAVHGMARGTEAKEKVREVLQICGLAPYHYGRYPHEFSGGQRQRIVIARALVLKPQFMVADEPISALDVSIQSQIINLLERLQNEFHLTYLFISHDLGVVKHISDTVGVMYLGRLVEEAPKQEFFARPLHPYSKALISAIPVMNPRKKIDRIILSGDVPSPANPPSGCRFHTRCPEAIDRCTREEPLLRYIAPDHRVSCHLVEG